MPRRRSQKRPGVLGLNGGHPGYRTPLIKCQPPAQCRGAAPPPGGAAWCSDRPPLSAGLCTAQASPGGQGWGEDGGPRFPTIFPELLCARPPRMCVGALCVPCAEVVLLEAAGGLVTAPQLFRHFPAIFPQFVTIGLTPPPSPPRPLSGPHARVPDPSVGRVPPVRCSRHDYGPAPP